MKKPTWKAISIRQPWAWLIVTGYKDIENRDWKYAPSHRGQLGLFDVPDSVIKKIKEVAI